MLRNSEIQSKSVWIKNLITVDTRRIIGGINGRNVQLTSHYPISTQACYRLCQIVWSLDPFHYLLLNFKYYVLVIRDPSTQSQFYSRHYSFRSWDNLVSRHALLLVTSISWAEIFHSFNSAFIPSNLLRTSAALIFLAWSLLSSSVIKPKPETLGWDSVHPRGINLFG